MFKPNELGYILLNAGFEPWFRYMFRVINNTPYICEPLHKELLAKIQDVIDGKTTRLNLNLCPRSSKTTTMTWLVVYALTINPKAQIIYTSFNQELLTSVSQQVAGIMNHPVYQAMFSQSFTQEDEEVDPIDDFWKDYLKQTENKIKFSSRKILTPQGGVVLFNSVGSAITGFGCGIRGQTGFTGFLACFPYGEYVWTENGREKIGDIVKYKKKIKVWSVNTKTGVLELKPIIGWIKNPENDLLEVSYMGKSFRCTPDHKVYTLNRGYVAAANLRIDDVPACLADSFDLSNSQSGFISNFRAFESSVHNQSKCFWRQFFCFPRNIINAIGKSLERFSCFDSLNSSDVSIEIFCNERVRSGVSANSDDVGTREFRAGKNKRSNFNGVLHIFTFSSISKVFKTIVGGDRVKVSNFHSNGSFANKRFHNRTMNHHTSNFGLFRCAKSIISTLQTKVQHLFRNNILLLSSIDDSALASNAPKVRNTISSFVSDNRSPLLVRKIGHIKHSYCITVGDNHNMFVGKNQGFLVKNCDDADKPTDVRSQKIREKTHVYFQETLLSRLNNPDTPILNVQQRLHIDDLSGFLADKYGFEVFKFPLLDENGNCNLGKQYTPERIKELQVDKYTFSAQYQQEPILLGGGVIKHDWWRFYKDMHDCPYRRIFITADTAMKTKEWNDFTAIGVWGLTNQNKLRMLDLVHGKFEIPELEATMLALWEKWKTGIGTCRCSAIYIEDKASGTQLIQVLMRKGGLPIMRLMPEKDKYTRVMNAIPQLASGNVELPESDQHPLSKLLIDEADAFTADDSHLTDDIVDCWCYAVDQAFNSRGII